MIIGKAVKCRFPSGFIVRQIFQRVRIETEQLGRECGTNGFLVRWLRHGQQDTQQLRRLAGFQNAGCTINNRWDSILRQRPLNTRRLRVVIDQNRDVARLNFLQTDFCFTGQ